MYIPPHFKISDKDEIEKFVRANPFGLLISQGDKILATHIPIQLRIAENGNWFLNCHVSKANPQAALPPSHNEVLVIFQGAHHYISSSWYQKDEVSTWNYRAVHLYGKIREVSEEELLESVKLLTNFFEAKSANPKTFDKIPERIIAQNISGIVGFEIEVTEIQASYKLSQNRSENDRQNIANELSKMNEANAHEIADAMQKQKQKK